MKEIKAASLLKGLAGAQRPELSGVKITSVETDSRRAGPGCLFAAICGERVDGHDYAAKALAQGAALVVCEKEMPELPAEKYFRVPDILDALITMGGNYRAQFSPCLVGVTGSVGKTSTKEFIAAVLSSFGPTLKTEGNQNNEIGMPNTLFRLDEKARYAVVEMGMQGLGEIRKLTLAARPQAAVITCIGVAHLEQLKTRENILKAKMEICEGLPQGGLLVINGDDALLTGAPVPPGIRRTAYAIDTAAPVRAEGLQVAGTAQRFTIRDAENGVFAAEIPVTGKHNVYNALAAYTLATRLGLPAAAAAAALGRFCTVGYRQRLETVRGVQLMEDCYNANPDSMRAALDTLHDAPAAGRKMAVLADMLELGTLSEAAHREVGCEAAKAGVECLLTYGKEMVFAAEEARKAGVPTVLQMDDKAAAARWLVENCRPGDYVLFKGSHSMALEDVFEAFRRA